MTTLPNSLAVAICQAAPIPLAIGDGIDKAVRLAREAIEGGAQLVAFGETFLGGYPLWLDEAPGAALWDHPGSKALHRILLEQVAGITVEALQAAAEDGHISGRRRQQSCRHVEERGLAAAGRPDDGDELAGTGGQAGAADGVIACASGHAERDRHGTKNDSGLAEVCGWGLAVGRPVVQRALPG